MSDMFDALNDCAAEVAELTAALAAAEARIENMKLASDAGDEDTVGFIDLRRGRKSFLPRRKTEGKADMRLAAAEERIRVLTEALEPLAREARMRENRRMEPDSHTALIPIGLLRRANRAITPPEGEPDNG